MSFHESPDEIQPGFVRADPVHVPSTNITSLEVFFSIYIFSFLLLMTCVYQRHMILTSKTPSTRNQVVLRHRLYSPDFRLISLGWVP